MRRALAVVALALCLAASATSQTTRRDTLLFVWALAAAPASTAERYDGKLLTPRDFLRDGGVCRDRAALYVLAADALGIRDARYVFGYVGDSATLHAWVYVEGEYIEPALFGRAYDVASLTIKGTLDAKALLKLLNASKSIEAFLKGEDQ